MINYVQCVTNCGVNMCKIYRQFSKKWSVFIWSAEEKSIGYNFRDIYLSIPFWFWCYIFGNTKDIKNAQSWTEFLFKIYINNHQHKKFLVF